LNAGHAVGNFLTLVYQKISRLIARKNILKFTLKLLLQSDRDFQPCVITRDWLQKTTRLV